MYPYRNGENMRNFLQNLGMRFARFMQGRNGMDDLGKALNVVVIVLLLLSIFTRAGLFYILALAVMVYMYFRVFSKNTPKRYKENQRYRNFRYDTAIKWNKKKLEWNQRKIYRFFRCPMCKQKVRVPKGRGKICITCPKCKAEFIKRS